MTFVLCGPNRTGLLAQPYHEEAAVRDFCSKITRPGIFVNELIGWKALPLDYIITKGTNIFAKCRMNGLQWSLAKYEEYKDQDDQYFRQAWMKEESEKIVLATDVSYAFMNKPKDIDESLHFLVVNKCFFRFN